MPDYSKCWKCGMPAGPLETKTFCHNRACSEHQYGVYHELWRSIHNRIESVAQEREAKAQQEEREEFVKECRKFADEHRDDFAAESVGYRMRQLIDRIRARGK